MNVYQLGKIKPGSIVCDANDPKQLFRVIEHLTIFDGFDLGYGYGDNDEFAYGETKRICRVKSFENDCLYRYPATKKVILLESPDGQITRDALRLPSPREYDQCV